MIRQQEGKTVPVWLTVLISLGSIVLTTIFTVGSDRLTLATSLSQLEVRVRMLEESRTESKAMDAEILKMMRLLNDKVSDNALVLQEIKGRQQEVRRVLKLPN